MHQILDEIKELNPELAERVFDILRSNFIKYDKRGALLKKRFDLIKDLKQLLEEIEGCASDGLSGSYEDMRNALAEIAELAQGGNNENN